MNVKLEVTGLEELRDRFKRAPKKFNSALKKTLEAALLKIWEIVGNLGYPRPPQGSKYTRTGTLGRTIGTSQFGGRSGSKPEIYKIEKFGNYQTGEFGTRLHYARYVIGEKQAWMHVGRWWNIKQVAEKAKAPIEKLFNLMAEELARWLEGQGL